MLLRNILIRAVCLRKPIVEFFNTFPTRPNLSLLSMLRNFSKGRVFPQIFAQFLKQLCQYFFPPDYYNAPVLPLGTQEGLPVDNLLLQLSVHFTRTK